jgi:RNA:NAD 2'-phosphotransferase (TPT1/KptA family)
MVANQDQVLGHRRQGRKNMRLKHLRRLLHKHDTRRQRLNKPAQLGCARSGHSYNAVLTHYVQVFCVL